jgi:hypothetical protein
VALKAAHRLHPALALCFLALQIGARLRIKASTGDSDDVQNVVELAVAPTMKTMAVPSPRGSGYRSDARHPGEVRVALEALGTGRLSDQDRGGERATASLG